MARIFLALALFAVLLLASNLLLALVIGDFGASSGAYQRAREEAGELANSETASREEVAAARDQTRLLGQAMVEHRDRFWAHVWLGIIAALVSLLVNSISVTYFIGTSRWCREVVDAYGMDESLAEKSQQLKRRSFPWALTGILVTLAIAALGAAADPYSSMANPASWVTWHWACAMAGTVVIGTAFLVQVGAVGANYDIINTILAEAEKLRAERDAKIAEVTVQDG